jgi:hypothetical protein
MNDPFGYLHFVLEMSICRKLKKSIFQCHISTSLSISDNFITPTKCDQFLLFHYFIYIIYFFLKKFKI